MTGEEEAHDQLEEGLTLLRAGLAEMIRLHRQGHVSDAELARATDMVHEWARDALAQLKEEE